MGGRPRRRLALLHRLARLCASLAIRPERQQPRRLRGDASGPDLGRLPFSDAKGIRLSGPPALSLTLATPRGTVSWTETDPHGFFG